MQIYSKQRAVIYIFCTEQNVETKPEQVHIQSQSAQTTVSSVLSIMQIAVVKISTRVLNKTEKLRSVYIYIYIFTVPNNTVSCLLIKIEKLC